ncbi:uncharacterized protein MAL8P1.12 isoform X2 [Hydra vulgaris]|uniref:uncharacterized protein MAL8P1.12 isoform X2 n=1 Tax=Hydra vulgaris TaxID=6087 RepID=UPI0032E9FC3E
MSLDRKKNVDKNVFADKISHLAKDQSLVCFTDNLSSSIFDIFKEDNSNSGGICLAEQSNCLTSTSSIVDPFENEIQLGYKSQSLPYIKQNGSTQSRKKTTEASPLFDPMQLKMQKELSQLQEKLAISEEKQAQLLLANSNLEEQCQMLNLKCSEIMKELQHKKTELNMLISNKNKEILLKDEQISQLKKKMSDLFNNLDDKSSKKEKTSEQRQNYEQGTLKELTELRDKCQYLQNALWQHGQCKIVLENELHNLKLHVNSSRETSYVKEANNGNKNDIDLLRQQLDIYAEDFKAEKAEKEKLLAENQSLRKQLVVLNEEKEPLMRQLQYYEEDFRKERDKRIELLRKNNMSSESSAQSSFSLCPSYSDGEAQRKWKEYCCLVVEKENLTDRINELENQGITRYNGRVSDQNSNYSNTSFRSKTPNHPQQKLFQRSPDQYYRPDDWPNNVFGNRMGSESSFDAHHYYP